jgi:hypothetical protein
VRRLRHTVQLPAVLVRTQAAQGTALNQCGPMHGMLVQQSTPSPLRVRSRRADWSRAVRSAAGSGKVNATTLTDQRRTRLGMGSDHGHLASGVDATRAGNERRVESEPSAELEHLRDVREVLWRQPQASEGTRRAGLSQQWADVLQRTRSSRLRSESRMDPRFRITSAIILLARS